MHVWEIIVAILAYSGGVFYLGSKYGAKLKAAEQAELNKLRQQAAGQVGNLAQKISKL